MTRGFKFVAAVLAIVFLAGGLSAFVFCPRGDAMAIHKCCGPHCPMVAKAQSAGSGLQVKPEGGPCCKVSPMKPVPASVSLAPGNRSLVAPLLAVVEPFASTLPAPKTESRDEAPPFRSSPPRSALCVFLI